MHLLSDTFQAEPVHKFKDGWNDLVSDDVRDGPNGRGNVLEKSNHGLSGRRFWDQAKGDGSNDRKGPLRSNDKPGQVIACDAFHGLHTGLNDLPRGKRNCQPQNIISCHAVLYGP